MLGTRIGRPRDLAVILLCLCVSVSALRSVAGCAEPNYGVDSLPLLEAGPRKDAGGTELGDAMSADDAARCSEPVCMTQLALGGGFACALGDDGVVRCWGDNDKGQTGAPDPATPTRKPRAVGGLAAVKQITTGTRHACALQLDGKVLCWGDDENGLVSGTAGPLAHPVPVEVPGLLRPVDRLVAVSDHQCAILSGNDLYCWGNNEYGQLGVANPDGGKHAKSIPRPTHTLANVVQVGGAEETTCALRTSGEVSCFGRNFSGELGNGTSNLDPNSVAVSVIGLTSPVAQLTSGTGLHIGVALADGRVQAWGSNARNAMVPTPIVGSYPAPAKIKL